MHLIGVHASLRVATHHTPQLHRAINILSHDAVMRVVGAKVRHLTCNLGVCAPNMRDDSLTISRNGTPGVVKSVVPKEEDTWRQLCGNTAVSRA